MRSRMARRREAWWLIIAAAGVVGILLLLAAAVASSDGATKAAYVQAAILLATAGVIGWYTLETQRLRETAERQVAKTQGQARLMLLQAQVSSKSAQLAVYVSLVGAGKSPVNIDQPYIQLSVLMRELQELEQKLAARPPSDC